MKRIIKKLNIPVKTSEDATEDSLLQLSFTKKYDGWSCMVDKQTMLDMVNMINNRNYPTSSDSIVSIVEEEQDFDYCLSVVTVEKLVKHMNKLNKHVHDIAHTDTRRALENHLAGIYQIINNAD
jgi:hypothetical protein